MLDDDDAIESRCLAAEGEAQVYLVCRATRQTRKAANSAVNALADGISGILATRLPGWEWQSVSEADIATLLDPFETTEGGDLVRQEIEVSFAGDKRIDISAFAASDRRKPVGALIEFMCGQPQPILLALAAQPAHIDEAESLLLNRELGDLAGSSYSAQTSPLAAAQANEALTKRLSSRAHFGQLRVSLASPRPLSASLAAIAGDALAAEPGSLKMVQPTGEADREAFSRNLTSVGFELWGPDAEATERAHISDAYFASLEEITATWTMPLPDGFTPLDVEMMDPPSRPVPRCVPSEGLIVGDNGYHSAPRQVALSDSDRSRHMYVVGQTGAGKSTLLLNMIMQDIEAGMGLDVVDPHGDLVDDILARFPKSRAEDLILVDPSDTERPVALNVLESGTDAEQDFVIQSMIEMLYRIYDPGHTGIMGPRFEHWFRNGALTVMASPEGGSLLDIPRVFTDDAFLAGLLQHVTDLPVRSFWINELGQTSDFHKSEMLGWFVGKFGAFLTNRAMRDVVGQRSSSFDMRDAMDTGKVVLVRLSKGLLGDINLKWLGMIAVAKIQLAAMGRASVPRDQRRPFGLYVDEFQNFALGSFDEMISEARKYGLSLTMSHQHIGQLPEEFRRAVFGNVGAIAAFRLGSADAESIADEMAGYRARDLTRIENYRCVLRLAVGGRVQPAFDVKTRPARPCNQPESGQAVRELSRLKYGRSVELVEKEVLAAYQS